MSFGISLPARFGSRPPTMRRTRSSGRNLRNSCADYPDIKVEIIVDYGLTDIVAQRYDAGVRSGEQVAKDMIAVRIGPDMRMAVVGAPSYFAKRSAPKKPQDLNEPQLHQSAPANAWRVVRLGVRKGRPRTEGARRRPARLQRHCSDAQCGAGRIWLGLCAGGCGAAASSRGRLKRVLEDWCPPFPGYHLYYPSRRHSSPAFALLVDALRHRS